MYIEGIEFKPVDMYYSSQDVVQWPARFKHNVY